MEHLKNKISSLGIKQTWLAEKLGVSSAQLSYWLNETRPIPKDKETELKNILSKLEAIV